MNDDDILRAARERFDRELHTSGYRTIHSDDDHLARLIGLCGIKPGRSYLDLGTGNGYVAFALARRFPDVSVRGLDIAVESIRKNNEIAAREGLTNLSFAAYDGRVFPFADKTFHGAVSRYAFHHFPDPAASAAEIARVIGDGGFFLLSDPVTLPEDADGFIDRFQALVPDGHVHFYPRREIGPLFAKAGFNAEKEFESGVRYPREMNGDYERLFEKTSRAVLDAYSMEEAGDKVYITVKVMNILFRKRGKGGRR